jgi:hypothetical protein
MSASVLHTSTDGDPRVDGGQRGDLVDRLIELRKALHASVGEISRLRRTNAALRKDNARLEAELAAERRAAA